MPSHFLHKSLMGAPPQENDMTHRFNMAPKSPRRCDP